jgi:methylated-DNA-[protein]-cysteine S-methyltransferase
MHYTTAYPSPLGLLTLASDGDNLTGLWIEGQKYFKANITEAAAENADIPVFNNARNWLDRYFSGGRPDTSWLPLKPCGSEFRRFVWDVLRGIPYGELITYGDIAKQLGGAKASARAVGGAVGHNPISIILPCHRVVGAGGNLTGYAGGIDVKIKLLKLEGVDTTKLK